MKLNVVSNLSEVNAKLDTLVVFTDADKNILKTSNFTYAQLEELKDLLQKDRFKGSAGAVSHFYNLSSFPTVERVVVVGLGEFKDDKVSAKALHQTATSLVKAFTSFKPTAVAILLPENLLSGENPVYRTARVFVEGLNFARYQFKRFLTLDKTDNGHGEDCSCCTGVKSYEFVVAPEFQAEFTLGLEEGAAVSAGVKLARDLGNLPANICTPKYLSETGKKLEADYDKISVTVVDEKEMEELGMNCYLAVGKGSVNRPYMTVVRYNGAEDRNQAPFVLVGKGMTFDTGGYSIKPAASMEEMKYDMCGAASVLGVMKAIAELELPLNVIGVAAGCENMVDANAYRPGDIVKSMNGLTVEINNTDAEGRLVLCDALTYVKRFNPQAVVDIATLTGACLVALGSRLTGVFSNTEGFAEELVSCGNYVEDKGWHLPLDDDFRNDTKGNHADLTNSAGRLAGSSTAAAFLSYFTKDYKWSHLDIAGTAWVSGKNHLATGRPVSLLVKYLQNQVK